MITYIITLIGLPTPICLIYLFLLREIATIPVALCTVGEAWYSQPGGFRFELGTSTCTTRTLHPWPIYPFPKNNPRWSVYFFEKFENLCLICTLFWKIVPSFPFFPKLCLCLFLNQNSPGTLKEKAPWLQILFLRETSSFCSKSLKISSGSFGSWAHPPLISSLQIFFFLRKVSSSRSL